MNWLTTLSATIFVTIGGFFGHLFGNSSGVQSRPESMPTVSTITAGEAVTDSIATSTVLVGKKTSSEKAGQVAPPPSSVALPKDWATFSSELGFSIHYPYKEMGAMYGDDEYFQIFFFMPASIVSADASTTENVSRDIHNLKLYESLSITSVKSDSPVTDMKLWAKAYLKKYDGEYGNNEKVLSEVVTPVTVAGVAGVQFDRSVEGDESQKSPHYMRREIFIYKDKLVYHIRNVAPSSDTTFSRSKTAGKKYLQRVDELVQQVLKTFVFDGSKVTKIIVPKVQPPALSGEALARREKLLVDLRSRPYYDMNTWYPKPSNPCETEVSADPATQISISNHSLYVTTEGELADLHIYDDEGRHSGPLPSIPGLGAPTEERVNDVYSFNFGTNTGFSLSSLMNGRIELVGKANGAVNLSFRGNGNGCSINEVSLFVTKYSVATIPMTKEGDLGPISYDIDGDGAQDVEISLIHPLLPEKQRQLEAVFTDITGIRMAN